MKTRHSGGLFPGRGAPNRRDRMKGGGSAGNSAGGGSGPTGSDMGYKIGNTGWKSSRQSGGQSISQKMIDKPLYVDSEKSVPGNGGLAYDKSAAPYFEEPGRPKDSKR